MREKIPRDEFNLDKSEEKKPVLQLPTCYLLHQHMVNWMKVFFHLLLCHRPHLFIFITSSLVLALYSDNSICYHHHVPHFLIVKSPITSSSLWRIISLVSLFLWNHYFHMITVHSVSLHQHPRLISLNCAINSPSLQPWTPSIHHLSVIFIMMAAFFFFLFLAISGFILIL